MPCLEGGDRQPDQQPLHGGGLGKALYLHATRVNLGRIRSDETALWCFGPHDLSMIDHILGEQPVTASACGAAVLRPGIEDVVFVTLRYASGIVVLEVGWLLRLALALSGLLPQSWLLPIFVGLVLLELAVPRWAERAQPTAWHPHHIVERYGLFAIILLGEGVLWWSLAAGFAGFGMALLYPNLSAAVADISPPAWRGSAIGIYRFWRDLGYAIGGLGLGLAAQLAGGLDAAFWFVAASMFVSGALLLRWGEETHPRLNPAPISEA